MFQLAWPWMALALPAPWLARLLSPPAGRAGDGLLYAPFVQGWTRWGEEGAPAAEGMRWRWVFSLTVWALLVLAACRPQWLGEPVEISEAGRNLMLAIDVSGSMEAADMDAGRANRLDVVKKIAGDFIRRRSGDRVGLIIFGDRPYLQTPLSFDRTTVASLLEQAEIGIAGRRTAIGDAIGLAIKRMRQAPEEQAVLVLLTDGTNTAGTLTPMKAAELAAGEGLRIHTIGVGGQGEMVSSLLGMVRRRGGDLDEATLKGVAEQTGGRYFRAEDWSDLEEIYATLDELEPVRGSGRVARPVDPLFQWPLGAALILSMLSLAFLAVPRPGREGAVSLGGPPGRERRG